MVYLMANGLNGSVLEKQDKFELSVKKLTISSPSAISIHTRDVHKRSSVVIIYSF